MKHILRSWLIGMLLMAIGLSRSALATPLEETQLKEAQTEIDQHADAWSKDDHVNSSAKSFKVPVNAVRELSAKNQGWGAITIELSMAWELNTLHSKEYPFMTASLNRVEALRAEGKGWGEMARTLDIGLAPIVQEAQDTAKDLREDNIALSKLNQEGSKVEENRRIIREEHLIAQAARSNRR